MLKKMHISLLMVVLIALLALTPAHALAQDDEPTPEPETEAEVGEKPVAEEASEEAGTEPEPEDRFVDFLKILVGLVPVVAFGGPLIAYLVDQGKRIGLPDGSAPVVAGLLNLLLFGIVYFAGPEHEGEVQTLVDGIYQLAPFVVGVFVTAILAARSHDQLVTTGQGVSYSERDKGIHVAQVAPFRPTSA